jgi:hypothetical protein
MPDPGDPFAQLEECEVIREPKLGGYKFLKESLLEMVRCSRISSAPKLVIFVERKAGHTATVEDQK